MKYSFNYLNMAHLGTPSLIQVPSFYLAGTPLGVILSWGGVPCEGSHLYTPFSIFQVITPIFYKHGPIRYGWGTTLETP